jgi:hypothetical protein
MRGWRARRVRDERLGPIWEGAWTPQSTWPALEAALVSVFGADGIRAELFAEVEALELPDCSWRATAAGFSAEVFRLPAERKVAERERLKVAAAGAGWIGGGELF